MVEDEASIVTNDFDDDPNRYEFIRLYAGSEMLFNDFIGCVIR